MKKIIYKFSDGTKSVVEVSDEEYLFYEKLEVEDKNLERKETRRQVSMESLVEINSEPSAVDIYFAEDVFGNMDNEKLQQGIDTLLPTQKDLLKRVFYERQRINEIAKDYGIAVCSVSNRLARIFKKLKNFL